MWASVAAQLAPALSQLLGVCLPLILYAIYRSIACSRGLWECRAKSPRQTFEDLCVLLLFSVLLHLADGLEPCEELPGALVAAASSSGSGEEGGGAPALARGKLALPRTAPARAPALAGGGALGVWALRARAHARALLLAVGLLAAFIAALTMGALGGKLPLSLDSSNMWRPPAVLVVAPALALVAVCVLLGGLASYRAGREAFAAWLAIAAAAAAYHASAFLLAQGPQPPRSAAPCDRLVFHPHHYALALFCCLLLRKHGLNARTGLCGGLAGVLCYTTKCALIGVLVQGMAQYGPDSIRRASTCAVN